MEQKTRFRSFLTKVGNVRLIQIWDKFSKPFNFCWKFGAALLGITLAFTLLQEAYYWLEEELGLDYYPWADENLGRNVEIRYFSKNQCAAYNTVTGKRMSPKVRWISCVPERDSLTVFCDKEGRRGYLNVNTGKVVITGQYKHAWHFSEGLAAVVADNGKVGFINHENRIVIPAVYDYVSGFDYVFKNGICVIADDKTEKMGAIDSLGNIRMPLEYTDIFMSYGQDTWYLQMDDKCGLADADMNVIFEAVYDNVRPQEDNTAYLTANGVKQLVSFDGEVILPFVIDESWPLEYRCEWEDGEGYTYMLHPYLIKVMVDYGCFGVMDTRTEEMVIPAIYSEINMISKDLLMAEVEGDEENNVVFTAEGDMVM